MNQLRLSSIFLMTAACAVLIGTKSITLYMTIGALCCLVFAWLHAAETRALLKTILFAMAWANLPIIASCGWIVITGHREQGELYYEDGPWAFFVLVITLMWLATIGSAWVGLVASLMVFGLRKRYGRNVDK